MKYIIYRLVSYMFAFIIGGYTMAYTRFDYKIDKWDWAIAIIFFITFLLTSELDDKK